MLYFITLVRQERGIRMKEENRTEERLNQIDRQMAQLFCERMELAAQTGAAPLTVSPDTLRKMRDSALYPYYQEYLRVQAQLEEEYRAQVLGKDRVAYQGAEGAFAHIALCHLFPRAKAKSYPTWAAVFAAVQSGEAAYGVLPFENSHAGDVSAVLDLCFDYTGIKVCKVYDLPVNQNLLGVPGANLADIKKVISHPQAIEQSRRFLECLELETAESLNTAVAAKQVAAEGDKTLAAIASVETAQLYGLEVLAKNINSDGDNTTRFIVIGKEMPKEGNRFSLLFTVAHKAGRLAQVIQAIGAAGFNMECIKSRPMPGAPFEYYFYVELEGTPTEQNTKELLAVLQNICDTLRVLGVYTK